MKCPKKNLYATAMLLDYYEKAGYIDVDDKIIGKVVEVYEKTLKAAKDSIEKKRKNPHFNFNLISKSLFYSVAFKEKDLNTVLLTEEKEKEKVSFFIETLNDVRFQKTHSESYPSISPKEGIDLLVSVNYKKNFILSVLAKFKDFLNEKYPDEKVSYFLDKIIQNAVSQKSVIDILGVERESFYLNNEEFVSLAKTCLGADGEEAFEILKKAKETVDLFFNEKILTSLNGKRDFLDSVSVIDNPFLYEEKYGEAKKSSTPLIRAKIRFNGGFKLNSALPVSFGIFKNEFLLGKEGYVKDLRKFNEEFSGEIECYSNKYFKLSLDKKSSIPSFERYTESMSKEKFISPESLGEFAVNVIDEADKGIDGDILKALKAVNAHADVTLTASGTPIGGYPEELASIAGYNPVLTSKAVERNKAEYVKQCGLFQFRSKVFGYLFLYKDNADFEGVLNTLYYDFEMIDKKADEISFIAKAAEEIMEYLVKNFSLPAEDFEGERDALSKALYKLFSEIKKENYAASYGISKAIETVVLSNRFEGVFTKRYPGFANPVTFTSLVASNALANPSIQTRESLKGREEKLIIKDLKEIKESKLNPSIDELATYNSVPVRLLSVGIKSYALTYALNPLVSYIKENFAIFLKAFEGFGKNRHFAKANLEKLAFLLNSSLKENFSSKDLEKILSPLSERDKFINIFADVLGEDEEYFKQKEEKFLSYLQKVKIDDEEKGLLKKKYKVFKGILKIFEEEFNSGFKKTNFENKESYILSEGIKNVFGDEIPLNEISLRNGKIYFSKHELKISSFIDFVKPEYKEFLKKGKNGYIPYRYRAYNLENELLLDRFGNLKVKEDVLNLLNEDKSFTLTASRSGNNIFNLLDLISAGIKRENKTKKLSVVVNVDTADFDGLSVKDVIKRIDENVLRESNIEIIPVKRSVLDSEVKSEIKKKSQVVLVSNYESLSRGLDLSMLDVLYATGAMNKGKELIQYLSRLYSVNKDDAVIYAFSGGKELVFSPKDVEEFHETGRKFASLFINRKNLNETAAAFLKTLDKEDIQNRYIPVISKTSSMNLKNVSKLFVFKKFMSAKESAYEEKTGDFIEVSQKARKMLEKNGARKERKIRNRL